MKTAKNPEKKRFRLFSYLFNTRMGTMIFSIITAIFLWFAISINLYPTTPRTISHIPLTVDITGTAAELNGYSVIDYSVKEVTVQIEGNRSQVGNLDANDMIATPVVENVTSSGVKTLDISVSSKDGTQFTVKSISPKSVNVRFDKMVTKKYPIQGDIGKITSFQHLCYQYRRCQGDTERSGSDRSGNHYESNQLCSSGDSERTGTFRNDDFDDRPAGIPG